MKTVDFPSVRGGKPNETNLKCIILLLWVQSNIRINHNIVFGFRTNTHNDYYDPTAVGIIS